MTETTATSVTLTWDSGNPEPVSYYMIQYRAKSSENGFQEVEGVATTRYSIGGLSPYSEYEFRVMAVNNIGRGPPSDPVETRTGEQAPSSPPLHVQARMLSASTMLVQWGPPEEPNGQIRGYRVYYSSDMTAPLSAWQKHNTDDSSLTTISGLTPDITYSLRVLAFTSVGDGPPSDILQVKTQQGGEQQTPSLCLCVYEHVKQGETVSNVATVLAFVLHIVTAFSSPPVPAQPSSFEAEAELDTRIVLTWLWPVQDPITKYELQYWESGTDNKVRIITGSSNNFINYFSLSLIPSHLSAVRLQINQSVECSSSEQDCVIVVMQSAPLDDKKHYSCNTTLLFTFVSWSYGPSFICWTSAPIVNLFWNKLFSHYVHV